MPPTQAGAKAQASARFQTFAEFYPFYLSEHNNHVCRTLHFIGTSIGLVILLAAVLTAQWWLVALGLLQGYAWAWVGHFGFEKNKPASFKQPIYSFMGDWRMWFDLATQKIAFRPLK